MKLYFTNIFGAIYAKRFSKDSTVRDAINFLIEQTNCKDDKIFIISDKKNQRFYESTECLQMIAKHNQTMAFINLSVSKFEQSFHEKKDFFPLRNAINAFNNIQIIKSINRDERKAYYEYAKVLRKTPRDINDRIDDVAQLGYDHNDCAEALRQNDYDVNRAIQFLVSLNSNHFRQIEINHEKAVYKQTNPIRSPRNYNQSPNLRRQPPPSPPPPPPKPPHQNKHPAKVPKSSSNNNRSLLPKIQQSERPQNLVNDQNKIILPANEYILKSPRQASSSKFGNKNITRPKSAPKYIQQIQLKPMQKNNPENELIQKQSKIDHLDKKIEPIKKEEPIKKADPNKKEKPIKKADQNKKEEPIKKADLNKKKEPIKKTDQNKKEEPFKKADLNKKEEPIKKEDPFDERIHTKVEISTSTLEFNIPKKKIRKNLKKFTPKIVPA